MLYLLKSQEKMKGLNYDNLVIEGKFKYVDCIILLILPNGLSFTFSNSGNVNEYIQAIAPP